MFFLFGLLCVAFSGALAQQHNYFFAVMLFICGIISHLWVLLTAVGVGAKLKNGQQT